MWNGPFDPFLGSLGNWSLNGRSIFFKPLFLNSLRPLREKFLKVIPLIGLPVSDGWIDSLHQN